MQYLLLVANSHDQLLETRKLHYLITNEIFAELYGKATQFERNVVCSHIERRDNTAVRQWMTKQQQTKNNYDTMVVRELRKEAQRRHISDYNFMGKDELIVELKNYDRTREVDSGIVEPA